MAGIDLNVTMSPEGQRFARDVAQRFPREMLTAVNRVAGTMRAQLRKNLRKGGGADGVPTWGDLHPLTQYTRRKFMLKDMGKAITIFRPGKYTREIGWVDSIAGLAGSFHSGGSYSYNSQQRGTLIMKVYGATGSSDTARDVVGRQHEQPSRLLYEPYTRSLPESKIRHWMDGNLAKALQKTARRYGGK